MSHCIADRLTCADNPEYFITCEVTTLTSSYTEIETYNMSTNEALWNEDRNDYGINMQGAYNLIFNFTLYDAWDWTGVRIWWTNQSYVPNQDTSSIWRYETPSGSIVTWFGDDSDLDFSYSQDVQGLHPNSTGWGFQLLTSFITADTWLSLWSFNEYIVGNNTYLSEVELNITLSTATHTTVPTIIPTMLPTGVPTDIPSKPPSIVPTYTPSNAQIITTISYGNNTTDSDGTTSSTSEEPITITGAANYSTTAGDDSDDSNETDEGIMINELSMYVSFVITGVWVVSKMI